MSDGTIRVRTLTWAATTAVLSVLCTLLVTEAWPVDAAPGDDTTFVPTAGCRLLDTRPGSDNIGPRSTPIVAGDVFEVTVHGSNGRCTKSLAIPTDATAVALNATTVNPTANSNIRLYSADLTDVPLLSNLNVTAGGPATPNKVDVKLSTDGKLNVFNEVGSVDVILDVVGYYTDATLQELSRRVAALETAEAAGVDPAVLARITTLETGLDTVESDITTLETGLDTVESDITTLETGLDTVESDIDTNTNHIATNTSGVAALDQAQPFAVTNRDGSEEVRVTAEVVVAVQVTAPVDGHVTVNSTTNALQAVPETGPFCSITTGAALDNDYLQQWLAAVPQGSTRAQIAGTRTFPITAGATVTYNLVCRHSAATGFSTLSDSVLTAIFTPAP